MRNTKIGKFFTTLIYTVLLTIPMLSVLVRVIYVQSNHNAKDSYYGNNEPSMVSTVLDDLNDFVVNDTYIFDNYSVNVVSSSNIGAWTYKLNLTDFNLISTNATLPQSYENVKSLSVYYNTSYGNRLQTQLIFNDDTAFTLNQSQSIRCSFTYLSNNFNYNWCSFDLFYVVTYNDYAYLDNAFDYSLYKVVEEYGTGNINFVNWFGSLFFTNTNQLYFNFVNMYLNYALYISACYLFYLILSWFIKFITNLIENSFLDKARKE